MTNTLIVKKCLDPQKILLARYGQTHYLHLHKKTEKLKPTLTEARNSTGVWLINSRITKVGRERILTILDEKMIKITGRLKAWETRRKQTQITSRMWTWWSEASNNCGEKWAEEIPGGISTSIPLDTLKFKLALELQKGDIRQITPYWLSNL